MDKYCNATESLWHMGDSNILQWWRDNRLEFTALSDLAGNTFCVMATSAANKQMLSMVGEFLCERHTLFNSALKAEKKR